MKIVIDLDLHQAVQDFTITQPAGIYDFKSQDTIDFWIYFVRVGVVQDMGAGFALKFGMIATGDTSATLLAYQTASSHQTDSDGNVYYLMQVNFNTSQMASAISGKTSLPCTAEIRYQTSDSEIIHSLNISSLVYPTILVETGVTPPGVSTGYPDASTIELLVHKNAASGYAGLDSSSHIYVSQLGGVAELVARKDQPSGYPSLDANTLIPAAEIPIDGTTIIASGSPLKISAPLSAGDMQKSTYDTNNDGIVDHAALADTATNATNATTAATLSQATSAGALSTVWGKDAAGNQKLFVAPGSVTLPPDVISGIIAAPINKAYTYEIYSPSNYKITDINAGTTTGTCTIALLQNGGAVAGTTLNVTPSSPSSFPPALHGLNIAVNAGDTWQLVVSAASSPVDLAFSIIIQK
jgi:hypothetical protein